MAACSACGASLPTGARFCPACGAEQTMEPVSTEERKLATVLFADLVGSTALAESEDPERVRAMLDRFYDAMAAEIERTGGTVEKFAGDAVMAVFGAPAALEDHAERALHAALAMRERLSQLFGSTLALRIGVNTGDVVVGQAREMSSYVSGDAVNVGARLEQAAAPGEILAGERTVAAAGGAFEFGEVRTIDAKGKPEGVVCGPLVRSLTRMRPRGVSGLRRIFVGRESELDLLRSTYRRAVTENEPHLVTVLGEPGVGKTTLVSELWRVLESEEPRPLRRSGGCLPYGDGITYWPLADVLREHYDIRDGESAESLTKKLAGREMLGLAFGLDIAGGMHPLEARELLREATVSFVEDVAATGPFILVVEDIHWAEDDLLDLVERVLRDARGPILVLATARPELLDRRGTWGAGRRNATTIGLEPLSPAATALLFESLLALELPSELADLVVARAEGNPFFLEELVGDLLESGVIERRNGGWTVHEVPAGFAVPDSIHAVLAARVDRLASTEKLGLQAAAVVGRVFWPGPVVHLVDGARPDFDLLEERDFVRRNAGSSMAGEREYSFKHALTRDVAYASIPKSRRGPLHAALAEWLEAASGARDEHAALLAYHYAEAVRPEDADLAWGGEPDRHRLLRETAVRWCRRAGDLARSRYEMEEAVELYRQAVALCDDEHERALIWKDIGLANALRYDGDAFWSAMDRALEGPLSAGERADVYGTLAFQTSIRSGMWLKRPDLSSLPVWIDTVLELAAEDSRARVEALLARAFSERSERDALEAAALAERLGDIELRSFAFGARTLAALDAGRYQDAATLSEFRLSLLSEIDAPDHLCEAYESAVPVAVTMGRFREARRLAAEHAATSARLSPHHRMHSVSLDIEIAENVGDWLRAAEAADLAVATARENADTPCLRNQRTLFACGLACIALGRERRGRELLSQGEQYESSGWAARMDPLRLRLALVEGDRDEVERLVRSTLEGEYVFGPSRSATRLDALVALGLVELIEAEAPSLALVRTYLQPFALRALGIAREDEELLGRADELFRTFGLVWHADQTERLRRGL